MLLLLLGRERVRVRVPVPGPLRRRRNLLSLCSDRCVVEDAASLVIRGCYGAPSWVRRNRRHPREFNALSVPLQAKWVQRDATPVEHVPEL